MPVGFNRQQAVPVAVGGGADSRDFEFARNLHPNPGTSLSPLPERHVHQTSVVVEQIVGACQPAAILCRLVSASQFQLFLSSGPRADVTQGVRNEATELR